VNENGKLRDSISFYELLVILVNRWGIKEDPGLIGSEVRNEWNEFHDSYVAHCLR